MAVKVVRGLVQTTPDTKNQSTPVIDAQKAVRTTNQVSVTRTTVSEAAFNHVRSSRSLNSSEKIREPRLAKEVADDVSERIRNDNTSLEAHSGLTSAAAREHFA